ncbi:hypothetical protein EWM64_g3411 [Hericium alpestre]|uniref:Fungal-type protein kinase domain-containing protein n=1 Tax=Hericium alpestre TaxID=135208 RepID=A0A4Z0A309_9AGAM|nr:hypothetical protein EWM64_g3411 [Hericium alpestre]
MVLGNDDVQSLLDLDNATQVLMDKIVACQSTEEKAKLSKELAEKCSVWWLRVVAPVEMKPKDDLENRKIGVVQLCRYLSGSATVLAFLEWRRQLTFMRDYDSTMWAILVPEDDDLTTGKWYITVRTLSTSRAAAMSDRATLVWAVVEMGQSEVLTEQYVLKQAWRMERSTKEADFRAALTSPAPHVCDIIRSVDMGVKDGETDVKDETSSLRQGLQLQPFTDSIFANATEVCNKKEASELDETKPAEQSVPVIATDGHHAFTAQPCTMRVLTRTLMRTHGWPIKFFKDLLELITVIRDAIEGHRDLYFRGVVHRDISTGNILICYQHNCSDPAHNVFGCLIDLDYAKQTEKRIQYSYLDVPEERISVFMDFLRLSCNVQMDSSLAVLILRHFKPVYAVTYVEKVLQIFPETHKGLVHKLLSKQLVNISFCIP